MPTPSKKQTVPVHTGKPNNYLSSRRIAKIRSKQHAHVMRDIRVAQPAYIQVYGGLLNFELSYYLNSQNKKQPEYHLTKSQTIFLVSGYDMVLRACNILNENYDKRTLLRIEERYYLHPNTGKQHRHVLRDCNILNENYEKLNLPKIEQIASKDSKGRKYKEFNLTQSWAGVI
ncbi:MAG: hypothetical protein HOG71_13605 [Bacteroidetes bacterium]|jgi:Rha family phage regulatory protein|nr:hypothetical protein [Bacteroidota bacterium]